MIFRLIPGAFDPLALDAPVTKEQGDGPTKIGSSKGGGCRPAKNARDAGIRDFTRMNQPKKGEHTRTEGPARGL